MAEQFSSITELTRSLTISSISPILKDEIWRCYSFSRRPKRGKIWYKMFPKRYEFENYIEKVILIMCFMDLFNGIRESNASDEQKMVIAIGIIDHIHIFLEDMFRTRNLEISSFLEELFEISDNHKNNNLEKKFTIVQNFKFCLDKKYNRRYVTGTLKLLLEFSKSNYFLLNTNVIKDVIDKSSASLCDLVPLRVTLNELEIKRYETSLKHLLFCA